jgi:hypothetical protein
MASVSSMGVIESNGSINSRRRTDGGSTRSSLELRSGARVERRARARSASRVAGRRGTGRARSAGRVEVAAGVVHVARELDVAQGRTRRGAGVALGALVAGRLSRLRLGFLGRRGTRLLVTWAVGCAGVRVKQRGEAGRRVEGSSRSVASFSTRKSMRWRAETKGRRRACSQDETVTAVLRAATCSQDLG